MSMSTPNEKSGDFLKYFISIIILAWFGTSTWYTLSINENTINENTINENSVKQKIKNKNVDSKKYEYTCKICNKKFTHRGIKVNDNGTRCIEILEPMQGFLCSCSCAKAARNNFDKAIDDAINWGNRRY